MKDGTQRMDCRMQKTTVLRIGSFLIMVALMFGIFALSDQDALESGNLSNGLTHKLFCIFYPHFNEMNFVEQEAITHSFAHLVRKTAHFSLYFLLGGAAFLTYISYRKMPLWLRACLPVFTGVLYAISDEIHQIFVSGRSGEALDVLIDSAGVVLACFIGLAAYQLVVKREQRRENHDG